MHKRKLNSGMGDSLSYVILIWNSDKNYIVKLDLKIRILKILYATHPRSGLKLNIKKCNIFQSSATEGI